MDFASGRAISCFWETGIRPSANFVFPNPWSGTAYTSQHLRERLLPPQGIPNPPRTAIRRKKATIWNNGVKCGQLAGISVNGAQGLVRRARLIVWECAAITGKGPTKIRGKDLGITLLIDNSQEQYARIEGKKQCR